MTSRDFCYWLQGFFEISGSDLNEGLSGKQVDMVRRHLALVFKHEIDPSAGGPEHQAELNAIHEAGEAMKAEVKAKLDALPKEKFGGVDPVTGAVYRC